MLFYMIYIDKNAISNYYFYNNILSIFSHLNIPIRIPHANFHETHSYKKELLLHSKLNYGAKAPLNYKL